MNERFGVVVVCLLRSAIATAFPSFHARAACLGFPISDTPALFLDSIAVVAVALLILYPLVFFFPLFFFFPSRGGFVVSRRQSWGLWEA